VLRSTDFGTNFVHHSLNWRRAMTLCWIANSDISSRFTTSAAPNEVVAPVSIVFGTTKPSTKPSA
jgi:hypothetical protein